MQLILISHCFLKEQCGRLDMYLRRINSRILDAVGYDPKSLLLEVKFKISGTIYGFLDVSYEVYDELLRAKSKGHYFNKFIKPNYRYVRVR